MTRAACISVDLDALRCYTAIHGLPKPDPSQPDPILALALERLLEQFAQHNIRATLFCVGQDLENPTIAELLRQATVAGHELGNHTWSHHYNLRSLSEAEISTDIARGEDAIANITGLRPAGFRTPGYNLSPTIARILKARGYLYDSSLLPSALYYSAKGAVMLSRLLNKKPSRSQMTLPQTLLTSHKPYIADIQRPWRPIPPQHRHERGLLEIPICVIPTLGIPIIGTTLHMLGAHGFSLALPLLRRTNPTLFNLEFHAIDWIDHQDPNIPAALAKLQPDLRVPITQKLKLYKTVFQKLQRAYDGHMWSLQQAIKPLTQKSFSSTGDRS